MINFFDDDEGWRTRPEVAFDGFVIAPEFLALSLRRPEANTEGVAIPPSPIRLSSVKVYRSMFGKYSRWIGQRHISLFDVTSDDLMDFLEQKESAAGKLTPVLNSRIKYRYLRLLERVYIHLKVTPNPAQHACFAIFAGGDRNKAGKDENMATLTAAQQSAFFLALPAVTGNWKKQRDRAMQAMMLGAGLKVSEVIGLWTENVGQLDAAGSIPITVSPGAAGGTVRWHQSQLRPFAVPEVQAWLRDREILNITGPLLFPASLLGGRLNPATVYRQTKATFSRSGIDVARLGGRTLRNSFAVKELQQGAGLEVVGELMGHRRRRSTQYYADAVLPEPPSAA